MMEKDPALRIQTAAEVVERLKPWAGETVSSPRDPEVARRLREGDFELDSGGAELADTSISFQFDLATPVVAATQPATTGDVPPAPTRRMIDAPPIPARPITSLPPGQQAPIIFAQASPLIAPKKPRSWSLATALAIAAVVLGSLITMLVQMASK
jgi:hypothetical protein